MKCYFKKNNMQNAVVVSILFFITAICCFGQNSSIYRQDVHLFDGKNSRIVFCEPLLEIFFDFKTRNLDRIGLFSNDKTVGDLELLVSWAYKKVWDVSTTRWVPEEITVSQLRIAQTDSGFRTKIRPVEGLNHNTDFMVFPAGKVTMQGGLRVVLYAKRKDDDYLEKESFTLRTLDFSEATGQRTKLSFELEYVRTKGHFHIQQITCYGATKSFVCTLGTEVTHETINQIISLLIQLGTS